VPCPPSKLQGAPWSWKVMEFRRPFSGLGKSWKIAKVVEKSWKMMINDNVMEFLLLH